MSIPMVCFVTWNRLGLTIQNLKALFETTDDFELYIVDNNSQDGTWEYLQSINDSRIKYKHRFGINRGVVYAINYILNKRKKEQYFIFVENDVCIKTKDWITKFMNVMEVFPEVGLLGGLRKDYFKSKGIVPKQYKKRDTSYYSTRMVLGNCNCIRPEVFDYIGFWNEETYGGDKDMSIRINDFTPFTIGYIDDIEIIQSQKILCNKCLYKDKCSLVNKGITCFDIYCKNYMHQQYASRVKQKQQMFLQEVKAGKRTIYCTSVHADKYDQYYYNQQWAQENFDFFIKNAN
ncbi:MAG: glycosyltransferase [Vallitalea sp.]|jgi:glycosyltransferase involved in cell wall biosynthesis|nr:glycosyltransferase [Vallitalea sp.]